jgi:uncharacterized protein (TIGR03437 family)
MKRSFIVATTLVLVSAAAMAQTGPCNAETFPSLNNSPWLGQEMLGQVSNTSINVNVVFDQDMQVYVQYGTTSGTYTSTTPVETASANIPLNIPLTGLTPNTRYYYRLQYAAPASTAFNARAEHTFVTARPAGTPFTFVIQADPHLDNNSNPSVYQLTLQNELQDNPDFMVDLGDTMLTDKLNTSGEPIGTNTGPTCNGGPTEAGVLARAQLHRSFYDLITGSVPLFLTIGNHEGEWGSNLNGTPQDFAIWDTEYRNMYFPDPVPGSFFSGDTQQYDLDGNPCTPSQTDTCGVGLRRNYFSWTWGDALFIVLDPFWNQTPDTSTSSLGNGQDCCQKGATQTISSPSIQADWSLTLGDVQYAWLQSTLAASAAKYKFVFSHNLVGGWNYNGQGAMRGGIEAAKYSEWGGYNLDGTYGFTLYRPNMAMPLHQLLLKYNVTAFIHGHDHFYGHQELDGIQYQEVPQPSANNGTNEASIGTADGYTHGTILNGRGYLRVKVDPSAGVTAQYIQTWLPTEVKGTTTNGMVADTWVAAPAVVGAPSGPVVSSVTNAASGNAAIAPNTFTSINGTNLARPGDSRTWAASDFVIGMPTSLDGVSVTVNGTRAYVSYISPAQINFLTPPGPLSGPVAVQVTVNGAASIPFSVNPQVDDPAFFQWGNYVAATHADNSPVGPTSLFPGKSTPVKPGETITLWANGFGTTSTPIITGAPMQSGTLTPPPVIRIGGQPAPVTFAGLVADGMYQINVTAPAGTASGDQTISASYNGALTQTGILINVSN